MGAEQLHQKSYYAEWSVRTGVRGGSSTQEMIEELAELGFAWRHIAALVGVSVPAVQKWRRGERTTGQNRQKVAGLLAACDLLAEHYGPDLTSKVSGLATDSCRSVCRTGEVAP